ncbi:ATP-binding protein [Streptomyces chiangmaiensis]|uniref:ATP-binding protein n=1 Tax=Streptomyces chiangmaiensis TaxID=766497 RepID=A0ABU7F9E3_9ACTN|nr:ATP-binding protein [Streptomyces chiangmaiensis]MED7820724.1 ATP-binding protein [Streptomyces chiangmaiensis]
MHAEPRFHGPVTVRTFTQLFSCTPRGAWLARRLVAHRMDVWGFPYDGDAGENVTLVVAELAANAVRHGRVPGRDFRVRLVLRDGVVRVEVADGRPERLPVLREPGAAGGGYGLLLVSAVAERWGVEPRPGCAYKVVWAEVRVWRPAGAGLEPPHRRAADGAGDGGADVYRGTTRGQTRGVDRGTS